MANDIKAVIIFCVIVAIACVSWNAIVMKKYKNVLEISEGTFLIDFNPAEKINTSELAGTKPDGNGDYSVVDAIQKIKVPDDLRIKVNNE